VFSIYVDLFFNQPSTKSFENRSDLTVAWYSVSVVTYVAFYGFCERLLDLSNNIYNNTPRGLTVYTEGDGSVLIFDFFLKYLMRPMEDNVKRRPYRRRRFIICRRKKLFITPRPLVCTVSIWCKFPMWIAWHARYNGLNDSGDIKRRRYSIFFSTRSWRFKMYKTLVYIGTYFEHPSRQVPRFCRC
jgi:hypothetical protein